MTTAITSRKNISPKATPSTMSKLLSSFTFPDDGRDIQVVDRNGDPWFIAKDVCEILGIVNNRDALSTLDEDEKDDVGIPDAIGRLQNTSIINESGLYSLILRSRKPEAKPFKKWVTKTVLPSIRKHGGYFDGQESLQSELVASLHRTIRENAIPALQRYDKLTDSCHRSISCSQSYKSIEWKQKVMKEVALEYDIPLSWMKKLVAGKASEVLTAVADPSSPCVKGGR